MASARVLWGALLLALTACPAKEDPPEATPEVTADLSSPAGDLAPQADLAPVPRALRNQDVTIIYPLPPAKELDRMVWGSTYTPRGRLVPQALFSQLPMPLDPRVGSVTASTGVSSWFALRLVAVRLDPCFAAHGEPDAECRSQIRLIFQGIHSAGEQTGADDGAIHVLYELPREELLAVTREIVALTDRNGGYAPAPLGVHPILARQGMTGGFAEGVKVLLMQHLGEERIAHLTFMTRVDTLLSAWHLGGFDRKSGGFVRADLVTANTQEQILFAGLPVVGGMQGSTPTPTSHADNPLLFMSGSAAQAADEEARKAAFRAALRIENPRVHTPETIDCLSCHVALATRSFAEDVFGLSAAGSPDLFQMAGDLRLEPRPVASLENIHACSYNGSELGLNHRTVNESAAIAARLTELIFPGLAK